MEKHILTKEISILVTKFTIIHLPSVAQEKNIKNDNTSQQNPSKAFKLF